MNKKALGEPTGQPGNRNKAKQSFLKPLRQLKREIFFSSEDIAKPCSSETITINKDRRNILGLFLLASSGFFIRWTQKAQAQTPEEGRVSLPNDGPYLAQYDRIICRSDATKPELYAAREFQRLFSKLTGKELAIDKTDSPSGKSILIGIEDTAASRLQENTEKMGEEGFHIDVTGDNLAIVGGRPRGTLYGVYEFFEQYCGVQFLTHDHTFYPAVGKDKNFRIKGRNDSLVPPFTFRWSFYGETNSNPAFAAQLRTNTIQGDEDFGGITGYKRVDHNVAYLVPPAIYGEEHPEYYALVNGKRVLEMEGGGPQLCMTNPEVLEIVIKETLDAIEKNPDVRNFNVAQMDNDNYCTCDACAAIDAHEESHAGATLTFVNSVAERIEKKHPEVLIGTYAYTYTRKPPKTISARNNVLIQLCSIECCSFHAIDDPSCSLNQEFCDDMNVWNTKTKNIFVWHYNTNFKSYLLPFPNLRSIGKSVDYFSNNSGRGVFMQAAGNGFSTELSDLRNYVMSRCLWKPGRDSWQETLEFCKMHYAESAQPIIDYLSYYHDLIEKEDRHPTLYCTETSLCINPESVKNIYTSFEKALSLAQSEEVRSRVEKASLCARRARLSVATMELKFENGVCKPSEEYADEKFLESYAELCAKYNVIREGEHEKSETYLDNMRKLYAGIPTVHLENNFWRVLILPESNAKIIEMTYKPTGRNVIQAKRSLNRFRFEEWSAQGDGPKADSILAYEVIEKSPEKTVVALTAKDGARIERTIRLTGDVIHFETVLKAKEARPFDFFVHPEYDPGTGSYDPQEISTYVKGEEWLQANKDWENAKPTSEQKSLTNKGLIGGSFAYFNHKAGFGVKQTFDPGSFEDIDIFWSPERIQINLEMTPTVKKLAAGEKAKYAYEVHYLKKAPEPI